MPRKPLPSYRRLREMYDRGMTYEEIGTRCGVSRSTAHNAIRRGAAEHGDTWPLPRQSTLTASACPTCSAPPGEPCARRDGAQMTAIHAARRGANFGRAPRQVPPLPPYAALRAMYVGEGMSIAAIGRRVGRDPMSVWHALRDGARERGEAWPLIDPASRHGRSYVAADFLGALVADFLRRGTTTRGELAARAGVDRWTIWTLEHRHAGRKVRRSVALRVSAAIDTLEQEGR